MVNREQGGELNISNNNIHLHSIFTLTTLLNTLRDAGKIDDEVVQSVQKYIAGTQVSLKGCIWLDVKVSFRTNLNFFLLV